MVDLPGISGGGLHGHHSILSPAPAPKGHNEPKIDLADNQSRQVFGGRATDEGAAPKSLRTDPNILTGPAPAFQASLLEVKSDLQNVIKRVEAARELPRNLGAVAPSGENADTALRAVPFSQSPIKGSDG